MSLSLLILAAGIGSRFGGNKQLEGLGPDGQVILDYSIADARRAGFEKVVMVTRSDIEELTRDHLARTQPDDINLELVRQDDLGPPREKPWGTGHAVLSAAGTIDGPFAMINADDYYGVDAFGELAGLLRGSSGGDRPVWSLVAYRLEHTLSPTGPVTRGLCAIEAGRLVSITETSGVERGPDGVIRDAGGVEWPDDTPVSMNLWGFTPELFDHLASGFAAFAEAHADDPKAEYLIPAIVGDLQAAGAVDVVAVETDSQWLGVTHRSDVEPARRAFADLHARGVY